MVPEGWQESSLKEVLSGGVKNGYSPIAAEKPTGYHVLSLAALTENGLNTNEIKPVHPVREVIDSLLTNGDFIISRSNTPDRVGRSALFKGEIENCSYPDLMMKFRVDESKASSAFVDYALKSHGVRSYLKRCAAGSSSTMVKINKSVLEKTPLSIPSLDEQKKIAQILSTWDKAITTTEQLLANSQQQKKALMQQLLSAKLRLNDNGGREFRDDWRPYKLGELFKERTETGLSDLPLLSITANEGVVLQEETGRKNTSNDDKSKYPRIMPDDIGYNTMRMWQGRSSLSDKEGLVSPAYTILSPTEQVVPQFAAYLFKLPALVNEFYKHSQGLVSDTWNLKYTHFKSIRWAFPSIEEQRAIANVLLATDKEIKVIETKLASLSEEKKALMQQLLTGKRRVTVAGAAA